jgi:hypothetical protein
MFSGIILLYLSFRMILRCARPFATLRITEGLRMTEMLGMTEHMLVFIRRCSNHPSFLLRGDFSLSHP